MLNRDFDLNLLKVLIALLKEKNTYRAAELLGSSQPSVSRSLAKLRVLLDDPLFYRDKRGLRLSQRAEALEKTLPDMYSALLDTFEASVFKPLNYEGNVKIAMNAYVAEIYGADIYEHFAKVMPKLTIEILSWNERSTHLILADQVDVALSFLPMTLPKTIIEKPVGSIKFGFIANKQHYGDMKSINPAQIVEHTLSTVLIPQYNSPQLRLEHIPDADLFFNIALKSHHIAPLIDLTARSKVLFVAPRKYFSKLNQDNLHFIEIEGVSDELLNANIGFMYNAKNRKAPVFQWFEEQIKEVINNTNKRVEA